MGRFWGSVLVFAFSHITLASNSSSSLREVAYAETEVDKIKSLRNSRIEAEKQNEQILIEQLEQARLEDEKTRLKKLFQIQEYNRKRKAELGENDLEKSQVDFIPKIKGQAPIIYQNFNANSNATNTNNNKSSSNPVVTTEVKQDQIQGQDQKQNQDQGQKQAQAQPEVEIIDLTNSLNTDESFSELNKIDAKVIQPILPEKEIVPVPVESGGSKITSPVVLEKVPSYDVAGRFYVTGQLGFSDYDASNVDADLSWGGSFGNYISKRIFVEGTFSYSQFTVDDPLLAYRDVFFDPRFRGPGGFIGDLNFVERDLEQYNFYGVVGYDILSGYGPNPWQRVIPKIRGGVSYTRREASGGNGFLDGFDSVSSDAIDVVLGLGAEFRLNPRVSITGTFDYFLNVYNDIDDNGILRDGVERIEDQDYFFLGAGLKLYF